MERTRCASANCRAEIIFAYFGDRDAPSPIDADPHPEGTIMLTEQAGVVHARIVPRKKLPGVREHGVPLHRSHFYSCTQPDRYRRRTRR